MATAASIGGVALPQLIERQYDRRLAVRSLAAGGTLGILFPPSLAMIVYGSFTDASVAKLFMAGVVPDLMLTAMLMTYLAVRSRFGPASGPRERGPASAAEAGAALLDVLPFVVLVGGTMGSIHAGLATPTEAAASGCVIGTAISAIWGDLTAARLMAAVRRTILVMGNLLFIIYAAYTFAYAIGIAGIGERATAWLVGLQLGQAGFFAALFVLYTVLGCLVESIGMIVITVPVLHPVLLSYGLDPVWFGVLLVMHIELGQISPSTAP